jgi:hypothetical protein
MFQHLFNIQTRLASAAISIAVLCTDTETRLRGIVRFRLALRGNVGQIIQSTAKKNIYYVFDMFFIYKPVPVLLQET